MSSEPAHTEVALHMATLLVSEQWENVLNNYNIHITTLQEYFHEGVQERWDFFELSCRITTPLVPLGAEQSNLMEIKMQQLLGQFEDQSEKLFGEFKTDSENVQTELATVVAKADASMKAQAQKQQDEFFATSMLCRREVASTVAMLKSEHAATHAVQGGMEGLQRALDIATNELDLTRARYDAVTNEQAEQLSKLRAELQEEREKSRSTVATERDELAERIRGILAKTEEERTSHLTEMTNLHSSHLTTVERMRVQIEERTAEVNAAREELDNARTENLNLVKAQTVEKVQLQKTITELQCENERLKATLVSQSQENQLELESLEFHVNQKKQLEVEEFKRRLASQSGGGGSPAVALSSTAGGLRSSSFAAHSSASAAMADQQRNVADSFFSARGRSGSLPFNSSTAGGVRGLSPNNGSGYDPSLIGATSPLSPRAQQAAATNIIAPYRAASTMSTPRTLGSQSGGGIREGSPSVTQNLRSPSETYLKLQNISSSWKDRLAGAQ